MITHFRLICLSLALLLIFPEPSSAARHHRAKVHPKGQRVPLLKRQVIAHSVEIKRLKQRVERLEHQPPRQSAAPFPAPTVDENGVGVDEIRYP